jgi:hypothetical protein
MLHGAGVRRRVHNPPTIGAPRARHPKTTAPPAEQAATGKAGPRPTNAGTRPARADWTSPWHRGGGTGLLKLGATDSDERASGSRQSEQGGPQVTTGHGRKPARGPWPQVGRRWCRRGVEGGTGSHIRARSGARPSTRITAATGPPLGEGLRLPGSHRDGLEACSPGEVRASRPVAGRARKGRRAAPSTTRIIQVRVGHHVQGPGMQHPPPDPAAPVPSGWAWG